jgi:hypothetical protein
MAERHVAEAEAHVAEQAHILADLRQRQADSGIIHTAELMLADFQTNLAIARVHLCMEQRWHSKAPQPPGGTGSAP